MNFTFLSKFVNLKLTSCSNESVHLHSTITLETNEDAGTQTIFDKNQDCGGNCSCKFHTLKHGDPIWLQCKRFDREKLEPKIPDLIKRKSLIRRIEFRLNNCSVEDLDVALIADYLNQIEVKKLTLSHNKLSSVKQLANRLTNLEVLDLDNNHFTSLDKEFVDKLRESKTLKTIQLHGNPWECRCGTGYFAKFVADFAKDHKIAKIDEVLCSSGTPVQFYDEAKDCDITRYEIVYIGTVLAVLATTCSIVAALFYRYELEIKIWMYHHRKYFPSWFFSVDENFEHWKTYDAFVCYAQKDEEFVKTQMRPKLEDEHPKFNLCIHQRDWCPGMSIQEQIYKSVADSRRTIIVLSHNFLNSDYCKQEFQVARDRSLQDKIGRVIVIMLEDIATHRLNDELKTYINKYTYIPWQDNDWFWNKLRYVLSYKVKIRVDRLNTEFEIPGQRKQGRFWPWRIWGSFLAGRTKLWRSERN